MDIVHFLIDWWRQPSRYDWLVAYLESRNAFQPVRIVVIIAVVIGPGGPLLMFWSPSGPATTLQHAVILAAALVGMSTAVLWLGKKPMSRRTAAWFTIVLTLSMATAAMAGSAAPLALAACTFFLMITGYTAIFHSARLLLFVCLIAVGTAIYLAIKIIWHDPVLVIVELLYVASLVVTVPVVLQWLLVNLQVGVINSDIDPLTGLFNRRAVNLRINEMIVNTGAAERHLVVLIIDLDKFKKLNDTHGHAAGDQALVSITTALYTGIRPSAVLARVGGEEFLIADTVNHPAHVPGIAEWVRTVIPATPPHLSASVGAVTVPLSANKAELPANYLARIIDIADAAMYEAKRAGGNQFRVREWQP